METLSVFPKHNPTPSSTTLSADPEIPTPGIVMPIRLPNALNPFNVPVRLMPTGEDPKESE